MQQWKQITQITSGGTVLSLAHLNGADWLGSRAGLFTRSGPAWRPVVREVPFWGVSSVLAAGEDLLVGGLPNGLILSSDGGHHWRKATIEQTNAPITSLVASPNYADDGVVLAGTAGDGVLRSSDGGRYWTLQNWGMDNLDVLAIAVAPTWGRREHAVAVTADGLYWSPNGGRAWRKADAPSGLIVPALQFITAETVLGGSEAAGLIISQDGGRSWKHHPSALDNHTINALLPTDSGHLLAATGEGKIGISADRGQSWQLVAASTTPILSLCESDRLWMAGIVDGGVLQSADDGQTWQTPSDASIYRFTSLGRSGRGLIAAAPEAGVWHSADGGQTWQPTPISPPFDAVASVSDQLILLHRRQVVQTVGADWSQTAVVFEPNDEPVVLQTAGEQVWVGLKNQGIAFRPTLTADWRLLNVPFQRQTLLGLAVSADFATDQSLLAVTQDGNDLNFWRSADAGRQWRNTFNERRSASTVRIALTNDMAAISIGPLCFVDSGDGWRSTSLGAAAAPITALANLPNGALVAISADAIHTFDKNGWHSTAHMTALAAADLHQPPNTNVLLALTHDGKLHRWQPV